jgi:diguanylate cyclase (GGDEF)-like protein
MVRLLFRVQHDSDRISAGQEIHWMVESRNETIEDVRRLLEKTDVSSVDRERLAGLLDLLLAALDQHPLPENRGEVVQRLKGDLLNNRNLILLLRQQSAELDTLKKLSLNLTSSLNLSTVLAAVAREAMHLVDDAKDAHIFLYQGGKLVFGTALDEKGNVDRILSTPRKNGLTYTVAHEARMIVVEDMRTDPLYQGAPEEWKGSIIGIPLKIGADVVGVMNLARSKVGPFPPGALRLLQVLADQAAIAIYNARLHEMVSKQAYSDALTGLPNRRALDERLEQEIRRAQRTGQSFATIMMDLDGFKAINDTYGHSVGDEVLSQVAAHLYQNRRASDFLARYGGDELTLILPDADMARSQMVAEKVQQQLEEYVFHAPDGRDIKLGVSGGIAIYPIHAATAADLLRAADESLYRAKKHHRGQFIIARGMTGPLPIPEI